MLELSADPRLALEALHGPGVVHSLRRQNLERHQSIKPRITGQVDSPHPALADQFQNQVAIDAKAGGPSAPRHPASQVGSRPSKRSSPERRAVRSAGLPSRIAMPEAQT